ncbi:hypothetical protein VCHA54P489_210082 [Vibrio chagasii]|nr:hypothetical protein VCHA54P489_210082 [Vibrio chagasii]CAH7139791.1 hypothetical protein VCHA37P202_220006 [Vibrio chagasii]CAH7145418.1 hypothetical protein VCHA49P380_230006 [Vibrio chagasii]
MDGGSTPQKGAELNVHLTPQENQNFSKNGIEMSTNIVQDIGTNAVFLTKNHIYNLLIWQ